MALTDKELLLLDNLMYLEDSKSKEYETVGGLVNYYLQNPEYLTDNKLSGGFDIVNEKENGVENFRKILQEISESEKLMGLEMREVASENDKLVRARCFVETDEMGNEISHTVAFRGTGGTFVAWLDNFLGVFKQETDAQRIAREFIEGLDYDNITVTGHSKGGNLSMYTTIMCGEDVQNCVSFDGQGFRQGFVEKNAEAIAENSNKIKSVSAKNDFVNILLTPIAGINMFVENMGTGSNAHSPYHLYMTNKDKLDENNGMFTEAMEEEQDEIMNIAHNSLELVLEALPEDQEELIAECTGAVTAHALSKDKVLDETVEHIGESIKEYYIDQGHIFKDPAETAINIAQNSTLAGRTMKNAETGIFLLKNREEVTEILDSVKDIFLKDKIETQEKLILKRDDSGNLYWDEGVDEKTKANLTKQDMLMVR